MGKLDWILGAYLGVLTLALIARRRRVVKPAADERERLRWN